MLRSRFQSIPGAFNACLIPKDTDKPVKKKRLRDAFIRKYDEVLLLLLLHRAIHHKFKILNVSNSS